MAALTPSPSPFATLLRRSKFASYDPSIAQVFTTYGGDAHRGNWGLKRPLALRRRGAYITVKSVDTQAQQTEWNSGENRAKFMQRYAEMNVEPTRRDPCERFDSEFAPWKDSGEVEAPRLVQNPLGLKPRQFRKYLEQLRAKRPAFIAYLREKGQTDPRIGKKSLFELAQQPDTDYHASFLADETTEVQNNLQSRVIDRRAHKSGGLIYSRPSFLQTYLTTKPLPGRVLMDAIRYSRAQKEGYLVGFAGMNSIFYKRHVVGDVKRMKWNDNSDPKRGVAQFRIMPPLLRALPVVVGKRQGLKGMKLVTEVRNVAFGDDIGRSNTYLPGSVDYSGAFPSPPGTTGGGGHAGPMDFSTVTARMQKAMQFQPQKPAVQNTLEMLKAIIGKS